MKRFSCVSVVFLLAGPGHEAAVRAFQQDPTNPEPCPQPTAEGCRDPQSACDKGWLELAKVYPQSPCNGLLKAHAAEVLGPLPTKIVLTTTTTNGPFIQVPDAPKKAMPFFLADQASKYSSGLDGTYLGPLEQAMTCLPQIPEFGVVSQSNPCLPVVNHFNAQRSEWLGHQHQITSCEEFAWKEYYDYSRFEDQVARVGAQNHRTVYDIAYGLWTPPAVVVGGSGDLIDGTQSGGTQSGQNGGSSIQIILPPAYAIGARGLLGLGLANRDGGAITPPIPFPAGKLPKNEYYTLNTKTYGAGGGGVVTILHGNKDLLINDGSGQIMIYLAALPRTALALGEVKLDDKVLGGEIDAGSAYYDESWAWHHSMSARNAGMLDEELYAFEKKKEAFVALLRARDDLVRQIAKLLHPKVYVHYDPGSQFNSAPVINPPTVIKAASPLGGVALADRSVPIAPAPMPPPPPPSGRSQPASASGTSAARAPTSTSTRGAISLVRAADSCDGAEIFCLLYRLAALDQTIEDTLHDAQSSGCVGGATSADTTGPVPCDWSPKTFARRVLGLYQGEREGVYQTCLHYTEAATLPDGTFALNPIQGFTPPAGGYQANLGGVHQYFADMQAYWTQKIEKFGKIVGNTVTRASGDSLTQGGDVFGAGLSYDAWIEIGGLSKSNPCGLALAGHGEMNASAIVFGAEVPLADALVEVTDTDYKAHFKALDILVLGDLGSHPHQTFPVNIVHDAYEGGDGDLVPIPTIDIPVGPVNIELDAGLAGRIGIEYGVSAGRQEDNANGCKLVQAGIEGMIRPYAAVDGWIKAGVSVLVLSVGLKGTLTLVEVSLPVMAGVGLGSDNGTPTLTMGSQADLRLTFLSGHISAYVDVGVCPLCASFEQELVGWDGIQKNINLFAVNESEPLETFLNVMP